MDHATFMTIEDLNVEPFDPALTIESLGVPDFPPEMTIESLGVPDFPPEMTIESLGVEPFPPEMTLESLGVEPLDMSETFGEEEDEDEKTYARPSEAGFDVPDDVYVIHIKLDGGAIITLDSRCRRFSGLINQTIEADNSLLRNPDDPVDMSKVFEFNNPIVSELDLILQYMNYCLEHGEAKSPKKPLDKKATPKDFLGKEFELFKDLDADKDIKNLKRIIDGINTADYLGMKKLTNKFCTIAAYYIRKFGMNQSPKKNNETLVEAGVYPASILDEDANATPATADVPMIEAANDAV